MTPTSQHSSGESGESVKTEKQLYGQNFRQEREPATINEVAQTAPGENFAPVDQRPQEEDDPEVL